MLPSSASWDIELDGKRVLFGPGSLERLGEAAGRLGASRALLVSDPGLQAAGHTAAASRSLEAAGVAVRVFDGVSENPTSGQVDAGVLEARREAAPDLIVGLGGGSAMDCAKGINFILTSGGRMEDYRGFGKASGPMLPSIGVPTTAGTGSESQSYALISRDDTHEKMACGDRQARFRAVILDPELSVTQPEAVTAAAGVDALTHAVESYVTKARNPVSQGYALEAWRRLEASFETVLEDPSDIDARGQMLLGAHLAGLAIEHSMLGAAHACANPLTTRFDVTHGIAVGLMLPAVMRYNEPEVGPLYEELRPASSAAGRERPLVDRVIGLARAAGLPRGLGDYGIPRNCLPELGKEAASQWTAGFNPRPAGERDLLEIYEDAF